ncbi:MAG TPA: hypothetical protein EYG11_21590 [Candidatus Latescibacteria bacterium]|nr:hypothetical protein [Candidatus Latescibacterota bacterium]
MRSPLPFPLFPPPSDDRLSGDLQYQLWLRIFYRLQEGESMVTAGAFLRAMEEEYQALTRRTPAARISALLERTIAKVNQKHPETFLCNGVQNAIAAAFCKSTEKLNWGAGEIEEKGVETIRRFVNAHMRGFLSYVGLEASKLDLVSCVGTATRQIRQIREEQLPQPVQALGEPTAPASSIDPSPSISPANDELEIAPSPELQNAIVDGLVTLDELHQREQQRSATRDELNQEETAKIPGRLDTYACRGIITWGEAGNLRKLDTEHGPLRRSARRFVRERIEQKIRPAINLTVLNLEVFEALQRIPEARDPALQFLIRHRRQVLSEDGADLQPLLNKLEADPELTANLLALADRCDQEISMIALRLMPYGPLLAARDHCTVEEGFVKELRSLEREDISERLNNPSETVRTRPTTQIIGLLQLIDHTTRPTPFSQELRIFKIRSELDALYRTASAEQGYAKLERFLKRRLHYLHPGLTRYEIEAAERHIDKILSARPAVLEIVGEAQKGISIQLDPDEVERGVQIARVAMRVAGRTRYVPYKIMPEETAPGKYIIVRRDPTSGVVVPALKSGICRYVERDSNGFWKLAS